MNDKYENYDNYIPPPTPMTPYAPAPKSTRPGWLIPVLVSALVLVAICCGGFIVMALNSDSAEQGIHNGLQAPSATTPNTPQPTTSRGTFSPSPSVSTKPAPAPKPTIEDGVWTVGSDIPAGTYRLREAASSMCYWGIYKSGTNQDDIINNDIVSGGRPQVTLKKGQDFKSDCGIWEKIK